MSPRARSAPVVALCRLRPRGSVLFFTAPPTTAIYTLSLHDALPILALHGIGLRVQRLTQGLPAAAHRGNQQHGQDRKSTRLNSSHANISYAVFCLKKKRSITVASTAGPAHSVGGVPCTRSGSVRQRL